MSHRSVEGPMVLCKPSSRRTAGAWPGQGGREMQGPRKTAIFGGGGGGWCSRIGESRKGISSRVWETLWSAPMFASKQPPVALKSTTSSSRAERTPRVAARGPRFDGCRVGGRDEEEEEEEDA